MTTTTPQQPRRVLAVDDDEMLLALVRLTLAKTGLDVATVTSGGAALDAVAADEPDLLVLDIGLPDLSGWEVLRRVRETSDLAVLILSGRTNEIDKARALDLGADDYVTKPFGLVEFEARVNALLRRAARPLLREEPDASVG